MWIRPTDPATALYVLHLAADFDEIPAGWYWAQDRGGSEDPWLQEFWLYDLEPTTTTAKLLGPRVEDDVRTRHSRGEYEAVLTPPTPPPLPAPNAYDESKSVNPWFPWALDENGHLFVVTIVPRRNDPSTVTPTSGYGRAFHPGAYLAPPGISERPSSPITVPVYEFGAWQTLQHGTWQLGSRAALVAAAGLEVAELEVPDWVSWARDLSGADGEPFPVSIDRKGEVITLDTDPDGWPKQGHVSIVGWRQRWYERLSSRRDPGRVVTLAFKPYSEYRSRAEADRNRPPQPFGRFLIGTRDQVSADPPGWFGRFLARVGKG